MRAGSGPIFVTGPAGTGKSTLLRLIADRLPNAPVLAPTGVAALRTGGQTLHSFFRLPPGILLPGDDGANRPAELYQGISTLIIDEVSMARADLIDKVDESLRRARASTAPFGGVQVLLFGDPLQLTPVVKPKDGPLLSNLGYRSPHFFDAAATRGGRLETFELERVYRQRDHRFIDVLNALRQGDVDPDLLRRLESPRTGRCPRWFAVAAWRVRSPPHRSSRAGLCKLGYSGKRVPCALRHARRLPDHVATRPSGRGEGL